MYWTLMAAPWPGSITPQGGGAPQPVARALGGLFDNIALPHSRLRDLANRWTTWSDGHLSELAKAHRTVLDARAAPAAAQPQSAPPPSPPFFRGPTDIF